MEDMITAAEPLFQGLHIDGGALLEAVLSGRISEAFFLIWQAVKSSMEQPFLGLREYILSFLLLAIGAAMLGQMEMVFHKEELRKAGYWMIYLLLARQLIVLYYNGEEIAGGTIRQIIAFGNIFIPVFSAVLTAASGSVTSAGYMGTLMLIIYVMERLLLQLMIPLVESYMLLGILGGLWQKERVEKLMKLLEKGISLVFHGIFLTVTGIGLLQSMILPYVDYTKLGAVKKIISNIPGIGTVTGTTLELMAGSAVLLKNGLGVIGLLLMTGLAAYPCLQIGLIWLLLRLASVIYGLFGEKELDWCADKLGNAEGYLLKIIGFGVLLFCLWITLAVYTTNQRMGM